jgi:hypothetical protein
LIGSLPINGYQRMRRGMMPLDKKTGQGSERLSRHQTWFF